MDDATRAGFRWYAQSIARRRFLRHLSLAAGAAAAVAALDACSSYGGGSGGGSTMMAASTPTVSGTSAPAASPTAVATAAPSVPTAAPAAPSPAAATTGTMTTMSMAKRVPQLTIGEYDEPDSMDPHRTPSRHMWIVGWAMYDPLVISTAKGELLPNLAKSWDISSDGLTYTFKLRDDVKFHDGTKFNAQAVKYNFDRIVDPKTMSPLSAADLGPYDSTAVVDDTTIAVKLKKPYGPLLRYLSLQEFGMISPTAAEKSGLQNFGRNPVGTGPWKFVEWVSQDHITLAANPDYNWAQSQVYSHNGVPYVDTLIYRFIPDNQARIAALETGEVDAILSVPQQEVARIEKSGKLQVQKYGALGHPTAFIYNVNKTPTNDLTVRKALNLGLNRAQIVSTLYANQNTPAYGPLSPASFSYWNGCEEVNKYDLATAQKMLDDAGWKVGGSGVREKDGQKLSLDLYVFGSNGPVAEAVQNALKDLKTDVKITTGPFSDQAKVGFDGRHNLILVTFGAPDPRILRLLYHSANISPTGWCWTHLKEAAPDLQKQLDDVLDQGDAVADPAKRVEAYTAAQKLIVNQSLVLPVKNDFQIVGLKQQVQGWKMDDQNYHPRPYDVTLA